MYTELFKEIEFHMWTFKNGFEKFSVKELNGFMRKIKKLSYDNQFTDYFNQKYSLKEKKMFGKMLLNIECMIEKNSVKDFLEGHTDIIDEKMVRCSPVMVREGKLLGLNETSHVLLVGSGAMPISAAILLKNFNCTITCIDIDEQAIYFAQKWLAQLIPNNTVIFIENDVFNITNYETYSHIIITGHIFNKNMLLDHLSDYLKNEQKILLRNSSGLYRHVYPIVSNFKNYEILDTVDHCKQMPYTSYVIKPTKSVNGMTTPSYLFDLAVIQRNYIHIRELLKDCDKVFYALKANGEQTIINSMKKYAVPFEVSSIEEFQAAKGNPEYEGDIICSLPVKSEEMITKLYEGGCQYFVFDCWEEYEKLKRLAPNALKIVRIDIRDLSHDTIDYGMTEKEFYEKYNSGITKVDGVTFYNIPNLSIEQLKAILERCQYLLSSINEPQKVLNIGGNYRFESDLQPDFYKQLHKKISSMKSKISGLTVYAEPGRTVVKSAGMIFTKVISIRKKLNKNEVYIDAGIPSGILYPPRKVGLFNSCRIPQPYNVQYEFYATTCSKKLLFSIEMSYEIMENDILILEEMGTYSLCKSNHFHGWDFPQVKYLFNESQKGE
ncbi:MAG: hypothetical protein HFI23_01150 [Lachnospiraceae bacterium]|uniref:nicotianamine synthase family protein n=1 Tax=Candidatus Merdisoma sp. JLR.KK011 TaxID=3114299 RepID=UPI0029D5F5EC|nr:hypothetical protein [Lachnospiraceae bacterium]